MVPIVMTMAEISPSILNANPLDLREHLRFLEAGGTPWLHLDVMDGHFVPPLTFGPFLAEAVASATEIPCEAHLMVERPGDLIEGFARAGCRRVIVHAEATHHMNRLIGEIQAAGCEAGVSLNPATGIHVLEEILPVVDLVLIMTVNPGWGGQALIASCLEKVRRLRELRESRGLSLSIEVDGGVNLHTIPQCVEAGADVLVVGSAIFGAEDPAEACRRIQEAARG